MDLALCHSNAQLNKWNDFAIEREWRNGGGGTVVGGGGVTVSGFTVADGGGGGVGGGGRNVVGGGGGRGGGIVGGGGRNVVGGGGGRNVVGGGGGRVGGGTMAVGVTVVTYIVKHHTTCQSFQHNLVQSCNVTLYAQWVDGQCMKFFPRQWTHGWACIGRCRCCRRH